MHHNKKGFFNSRFVNKITHTSLFPYLIPRSMLSVYNNILIGILYASNFLYYSYITIGEVCTSLSIRKFAINSFLIFFSLYVFNEEHVHLMARSFQKYSLKTLIARNQKKRTISLGLFDPKRSNNHMVCCSESLLHPCPVFPVRFCLLVLGSSPGK